MNIAIITAGGSGRRMKRDIPKQFIKVYDKPVIVYTLEDFQVHPLIDAIEVVCLDGWQDALQTYIEQYGISKVRWIVPGGSTVQESIRNGVYNLENIASDDDTIIIHDSVRPLSDPTVLTDVIEKCHQYGNAVASLPDHEQIFIVDEDDSTITERCVPRETLRRVFTPQAYKFRMLDDKYHEAFSKKIGIYGSSYTNTMMADLGVKLHLAAGSKINIKITTPVDLELFKYIRENAGALRE